MQSSKSSSFRLCKKSSGFKSSQDILLNVFLPADAADRKRHEKQGKISGSRRGLFSGDLAEPEKLISLINAAACNSFHVFLYIQQSQRYIVSLIFYQCNVFSMLLHFQHRNELRFSAVVQQKKLSTSASDSLVGLFSIS